MSCFRCGTRLPPISFSSNGVARCPGCNFMVRPKERGSVAPKQQQQIPMPPAVSKMTGCPTCGAPKPPAGQRVMVYDGGSILCSACGSTYHECAGGESRTGYSPLDCPYCVEKGQRGRGEYLGTYYIGQKEKPKGDFVGDFFVGSN